MRGFVSPRSSSGGLRRQMPLQAERAGAIWGQRKTVRVLRIGTWNLNTKKASGKQTALRLDQTRFMEHQNCDVWLLTEVPRDFAMEPGTTTFSAAMAGEADKAFAAVWARNGVEKLDEVHAAAAYAKVGDLRVCSCVLPWRAAESQGWPVEGDLATITQQAIDCARDALTGGSDDLVWGGDWNLALEGRDDVGTAPGRSAVLDLVAALRLKVTTTASEHTLGGGHRSIDHIAIPNHWAAGDATQVPAKNAGGRLSDHDAYVVEVER